MAIATTVLTGCGDEGIVAGPSRASAAAASPSVATDLRIGAGDRVADGWPSAAPSERGAEVWAIYLAVGPDGDPSLAEASAYLEERGYPPEARELGCDVGRPRPSGATGPRSPSPSTSNGAPTPATSSPS